MQNGKEHNNANHQNEEPIDVSPLGSKSPRRTQRTKCWLEQRFTAKGEVRQQDQHLWCVLVSLDQRVPRPVPWAGLVDRLLMLMLRRAPHGRWLPEDTQMGSVLSQVSAEAH